MKVKTFAKQGINLIPIEAEVTLLPGLPVIHLIGQPDSSLRESSRKIKSALRHQNFRFPRTQQVLVNLRPNHFKKSSHGLDLAIAAGILWASGQATPPTSNNLSVYGELTLDGKVFAPDDIEDLPLTGPVLTGQGFTGCRLNREDIGGCLQIAELADIDKPIPSKTSPINTKFQRPAMSELAFSSDQARLLTIIAAGEHGALFAGAAGSGKTTLAKTVHSLLAPPNADQAKDIRRAWRGEKMDWRPAVSPHHSSTVKSVIGGGANLRPGLASRAHHGVLLLDELLEFSPAVVESLREACDHGQIHLAAVEKGSANVPADFLLLGTTNLCACGSFTPTNPYPCRCSNTKKRRYLEKLSGPFLDRFQILSFFNRNPRNQSGTLFKTSTILQHAQKARSFARTTRQQTLPNGKLKEAELLGKSFGFSIEYLLPSSTGSFRRRRSILSVARTIADLSGTSVITPEHLDEALSLCFQPFEEISQS